MLHINVKGAIVHTQNGSMLLEITQTHLITVQVSFHFQSGSVIFNYTQWTGCDRFMRLWLRLNYNLIKGLRNTDGNLTLHFNSATYVFRETVIAFVSFKLGNIYNHLFPRTEKNLANTEAL